MRNISIYEKSKTNSNLQEEGTRKGPKTICALCAGVSHLLFHILSTMRNTIKVPKSLAQEFALVETEAIFTIMCEVMCQHPEFQPHMVGNMLQITRIISHLKDAKK